MPGTMYAKVVRRDQDFESIDWEPWINVSDAEPFPVIVLRRWLRDRGGVAPGERFMVTVYVYDDNTPLHKNGQPSECRAIDFAVNYESN